MAPPSNHYIESTQHEASHSNRLIRTSEHRSPPNNRLIRTSENHYSLFLSVDVKDLEFLTGQADPAFILDSHLIPEEEPIYGNKRFVSTIIRPQIRDVPLEIFTDYRLFDGKIDLDSIFSETEKFRQEHLREIAKTNDPIAYYAFQESFAKEYMQAIDSLVTPISEEQDIHDVREVKLRTHDVPQIDEILVENHLKRLENNMYEAVRARGEEKNGYTACQSPNKLRLLLKKERSKLEPNTNAMWYWVTHLAAHNVPETSQMGTDLYLREKFK